MRSATGWPAASRVASVSVATLMIGAFGTVALAGNQVAQSVGGVLYMLPLGVAGAVAIRVAQERGAQNMGALRPIALAAVVVAGLWLVTAALVLAPCPACMMFNFKSPHPWPVRCHPF